MPADLKDLMRSFSQFASENGASRGSVPLSQFAVLDCINEQLRLENARIRSENRSIGSQLERLRSDNQDLAAQLTLLRHKVDRFTATFKDLGLKRG